MNAQRIVDFRHSVFTNKVATDRNSFGDLEREFGIREPKALSVQNGNILVDSSQDDVLHRNGDHINVEEKDVDKIELNGQDIDTEGHQDDKLDTRKDNGGKAMELQVNGNTHGSDNEFSIADVEEHTTNEEVCESISSASAELSVVAEKPELIIAELPKSSTSESQNLVVATQPDFVSKDTGLMPTNESISIDDPVASQPRPMTDVDLRPAIGDLLGANVDGNPITNGNTPIYLAGSVQNQSTPLPKFQSQPQQPPTHRHSTKNSTSSSRRSSNVSSPATTQASVEPEDSDEEVVVFNPKLKRLSAQQKPPKQFSPRPPNHANNFQQVPQVKATIIDPDAFGRSFATNTRGYIPNGQRGRNSPRGSPRRGPRMHEPEVDYVLKSGASREASRGQGRLWVP